MLTGEAQTLEWQHESDWANDGSQRESLTRGGNERETDRSLALRWERGWMIAELDGAIRLRNVSATDRRTHHPEHVGVPGPHTWL